LILSQHSLTPEGEEESLTSHQINLISAGHSNCNKFSVYTHFVFWSSYLLQGPNNKVLHLFVS